MSTIKKGYGVDGVGNHINHQHIISDLIFGIRKKFAREHEDKYYVLSEISISQLGYEVTPDALSKDHNIDLVIAEKNSGDIYFMLEIERAQSVKPQTKDKIKECLNAINTISEAYLLKFNQSDEISFFKCGISNNKLVLTETSSKVTFADKTIVLSKMLVSVRK